jgi:hypothetical protein
MLPAVLTAATAALVGLGVAASPRPDRFIFAGVLIAVLVPLAATRPRIAIVITVVFLSLMALLRRMLISPVGWSAHDPLLLVGPAVALFLLLRLFVIEARPPLTSRLSKLIAALLVVSLVQVANPDGGGLLVGAGGLLFVAVPLLWFFIGRELVDRDLAVSLMLIVTVLAVCIGAYGLYQTEVGFPSWDRDWLDGVVVQSTLSGGYGALRVGDSIRSFGTLASPSEYLMLLGLGVVICVAFAPRLGYLPLLALPILGAALFLGSGRGALLLAALAVMTMVCLRLLRGRAALLAVLGAVAITIGALVVLGPLLSRAGSTSTNPLVSHQAKALGNPLREGDSTLLTHFRAFRTGIEEGIVHPLGHGTGSTNAAADRLGDDRSAGRVQVQNSGSIELVRGTDIDVSNVFFGMGIVGGLLYVAILIVVGREVLRGYGRTRDPAMLATIGFGIASLGQWLSGGHYLLAPFFWLLIGWATRNVPPAPPAAVPASPVPPSASK